MSQKLDILRYMAKGNPITPLIALRKFGCLSLSQRCTELRAERWPIKSTLVKVGKNRRVAEYRIAKR